jgi:hypothetical protein
MIEVAGTYQLEALKECPYNPRNRGGERKGKTNDLRYSWCSDDLLPIAVHRLRLLGRRTTTRNVGKFQENDEPVDYPRRSLSHGAARPLVAVASTTELAELSQFILAELMSGRQHNRRAGAPWGVGFPNG